METQERTFISRVDVPKVDILLLHSQHVSSSPQPSFPWATDMTLVYTMLILIFCPSSFQCVVSCSTISFVVSFHSTNIYMKEYDFTKRRMDLKVDDYLCIFLIALIHT